MPRRYRRTRTYSRRIKTAKYSNETYAIADTITSSNAVHVGVFSVVPETPTLGVRKVKNFTVNMAYHTTADDDDHRSIFWALVYVPQGTLPTAMNVGTSGNFLSLYEPNQNVILSSMSVINEPSKTLRSRLARNLNSGDSIYLVVTGDRSGTYTDLIQGSVNYAISY